MVVSDDNAVPGADQGLLRERSHAKLLATARQGAGAAQAVCSTHRVPRPIRRDPNPQ